MCGINLKIVSDAKSDLQNLKIHEWVPRRRYELVEHIISSIFHEGNESLDKTILKSTPKQEIIVYN